MGGRGRPLVLGCAAASILACGSGGPSANADGGGTWQPTPADLAFIDSFCAASDACCVASGETPVQDNCRNKLQGQGVSRDESLRSACLAELQQRAGSASCLPEQGALDDPCMRIFYEPSGPLQPGQHCTRNADCAGSAKAITVCSIATTPEMRICIRASRGAAGDHPCLGTLWETGVYDITPITVNASAPPIATGVICPYRAGVHCDSSNDTCVNTLPAGQSCTAARAICDLASTCDTNGGTCVPRLDAGGSCGTDNGLCLSDFCDNGQCSTQTGAERLSLLGFCTAI
jgi:hypothetical protein